MMIGIHTSTRRKSRRAFTLLELVMVITILAILMGTIVPNLKPLLSGSALKNTSRELTDMLRYARSVAIERSGTVKVSLNPETGRMVLMIEADPLNQPGQFFPEPYPVSSPKDLWKDVNIVSIVQMGITVAGGESGDGIESTEISFLPDGTTSDTFIFLMDETERVYTVGIVGLTGQVLVWNHTVGSFYDA